ncbi:MAG: KipI family sensor histidine kinase inhibitor [Crocinitomicaceae bacterium]|jgi:KipI family sensor histidine kinase inhibitor
MDKSTPYSISPYGPDHWLLQLESSADYTFLLKIHQHTSEIVLESVLGYDSLLLKTCPNTSSDEVLDHIQGAKSPKDSELDPRLHRIPVRYDGPDLEEVASLIGLSEEQVVKLHSDALYTVRFLGFSPGFAYLDGLAPELHLARRKVPRTKMATGAVAVGGSHAGIYTIPSPGGWNWLGHTDHPLFDPSLNGTDAFTLQPGDTLKFIPTLES